MPLCPSRPLPTDATSAAQLHSSNNITSDATLLQQPAKVIIGVRSGAAPPPSRAPWRPEGPGEPGPPPPAPKPQGVWGGRAAASMFQSRFKTAFVASGSTGGDTDARPTIVAPRQPSQRPAVPPPPVPVTARPLPVPDTGAFQVLPSPPPFSLPLCGVLGAPAPFVSGNFGSENESNETRHGRSGIFAYQGHQLWSRDLFMCVIFTFSLVVLWWLIGRAAYMYAVVLGSIPRHQSPICMLSLFFFLSFCLPFSFLCDTVNCNMCFR